MANIVTNNTANHPKRKEPNTPGVANLREIRNYLEEPMNSLNLMPGASPYERIVAMIRQLDIQDDGITMNQKIKAIEMDFCTIVKDENMLCESMSFINEKALEDGDVALKFALLFSSRNFDALAMKETKVRSAMLKILETNFLNANTFRVHDKERLYNSITLLGEYYNRVRLADNSPITILGESLIGLLIKEIEGQEVISSKLAKLILSQMTLNGDIMRARHQHDITRLLFHIRRNLVEQTKLTSTCKALLLMTLDLYYRNFANLGSDLESFYTQYLVDEEKGDTGNNNQNWNLQQQQKDQQLDKSLNSTNVSLEPESCDTNNDSFEIQPTTKKWSEQVCEDSMYENDILPDYEAENEGDVAAVNDNFNSNNVNHKGTPGHDREFRNVRRSHGQRSPRQLKNSTIEKRGSREHLAHNPPHLINGEDADQTKPLPRWRATRFNRDDDHHSDNRSRFRRFSGSFEDDHQSVRSEGGSIRLYSINDRIKHSQEKMERSNNNYSFIVNSNWDRQSQRDDRSERSYISNYEYGNKQRRGYRNYNNRQNYDKPPRFQKNRKQLQQHQQQQMQQQEDGQEIQNYKTHNESWRRTRGNSNSSYNEDYDETRASTLPRPAKSNFDTSIKSVSYRRSQSPTHQREYHRMYPQRNMPRNFNGRYGSQSSVHSEEPLPEERHPQQEQQEQQQQHQHPHQHHRPNQRGGRRFNVQPRRQHKEPGENKPREWGENQQSPAEEPKEANELVRNARQTTEYMNYLSSQK